jgi:enoyl-CoA hydratase
MNLPDILLERNEAILTVTFNRPRKYNAINPAMLEGLHAAFEQFKRDPELRVLLIRANGKYFSAGFDVTTLSAAIPEGPSRFRAAYRETAYHWLWDEFENAEKPIVVVHAGPCLGGALEMSLSCDFRLASTQAEYGLPEFGMGMIPGSGGTSRLVRLIGTHWARWLIMAGKRMTAEQAVSVGLVHQVLSDETFDADVLEFCRELAERPPEAMAAAKLAIELTRDLDRGQARNIERLVNSSLFGGEEQKRLFGVLKSQFFRHQDRSATTTTSMITTDDPPSVAENAVTTNLDSPSHRANSLNTFGSIAVIEARLRGGNLGLTERELQVTARILFGISALGIAAEFTLAEETIATYRKRAYERLHIAGRYELIRLYLELP